MLRAEIIPGNGRSGGLLVRQQSSEDATRVVPDASGLPVSLTRRQRSVLEFVSRGMSNRQIASELAVTVDAVKWHLKLVFKKLGVHSRVDAARLFLTASK